MADHDTHLLTHAWCPNLPPAPSPHVCESDLGTISLPYPQCLSPCPPMPALLGSGVDFPTRAAGTRVSYMCARAGGLPLRGVCSESRGVMGAGKTG